MNLGRDIWALDSGSLPWRCKGYSHIAKRNNHENWGQVPTAVSFNMLNATSTCVWAVDFEYHVYLFVKECDIPIRFQDYKFQYERWFPNFSGQGWRTIEKEDNRVKRKLSCHWTSDSVWRIDRNIGGAPTDKDGWQYATGFNSNFQSQNTTTTCVRRKRLARYYTYNKMGSFAKISDDTSIIKFLDIAAGGTMLTGSDNWPVCVWGVSKECHVYFRVNVSSANPEGDSWQEICQPDFQLAKLSVGPRGQLWGITTQGELITRLGIDGDNLCGNDWLHVEISVGTVTNIYPTAMTVSADAVWMIDCKGRVFFHKGSEIFLQNTLLLTDRYDPRSTSKWLHMVMDPDNQIVFRSLSCGPENQVWGLNNENSIYNRADISLTQISGQNWQIIEDPKLKNPNYTEEEDEISEDEFDENFSLGKEKTLTKRPVRGATGLSRSDSKVSITVSMKSYSQGGTLPSDSTLPTFFPRFQSYQESPEHEDVINIGPSPEDIFNDSDSQEDQHELRTLADSSGVHYWKMISAGGCMGVGLRRDEVVLKQAELSKVQIANIKECRALILDKLRDQSTKIRSREFDLYDTLMDDGGFKLKSNAKIEIDGTLKSATVYLSKNIPHGHLRFRIFLPGAQAQDAEDDNRVLGRRARMNQVECTVVINQTSTVEHIEQIPLVSLYGIKWLSPNIKQNGLLLYTANRTYKIIFERSTDCDNWFERVNDYVQAVHEIPNVPPNQSVWSLTGSGRVYFSPPVPSCVTDHSMRAWLPIEGNFIQIAAGPRSIVWGVSPDNNLYYFTRGYGGGNHTMGESLENFAVQRYFQVRENERYKLLAGFQPCAGKDRMPHWQDHSGNTIESENQYRLPVSAWRWIGDWNVKIAEDTDSEGWCYAKNFHSPFSAVPCRGARKRNRVRLAQMNINAPWKKIPINLVKISRVALEQYCFKTADESVIAWALCTNGSLLYRYGVTPAKPQGEEWLHVDIDHPLVDIALDAFCNLWAVCSDGSAYFRMGISEESPVGTRWMHIVKPDKDVLVKIAAGKYGVWALGSTGQCYIRTKISAIREYGQTWEAVASEPMSSISVNGSDQVFGIREKDRDIVSRDGVSGGKLKGEAWSLVLQDVWSDVCITATSQQHHWDQIDELTSIAMTRYRTRIWVMLRENRLKDSDYLKYDKHCPPIFPGERVCIRGTDGAWGANIIDHIGKDNLLKIRNPGFFTTTFDTVSEHDVIRDEAPHYTHLACGSQVLARLGLFTNKYTQCVVKTINLERGVLIIEESSSQYSIKDVRLPPVQLNADIYFLDGRRRHSAVNDECGREIII